jgi:uncharacterized protein
MPVLLRGQPLATGGDQTGRARGHRLTGLGDGPGSGDLLAAGWHVVLVTPGVRPRERRVQAKAGHTGVVRITIRVRPGSARPGIGGEHAGALVVRVSARAVGGNATVAALSALAAAFGVPRSAVTLVAGASSRTKMVDIRGADPAVLNRLLSGPGRTG